MQKQSVLFLQSNLVFWLVSEMVFDYKKTKHSVLVIMHNKNIHTAS